MMSAFIHPQFSADILFVMSEEGAAVSNTEPVEEAKPKLKKNKYPVVDKRLAYSLYSVIRGI